MTVHCCERNIDTTWFSRGFYQPILILIKHHCWLLRSRSGRANLVWKLESTFFNDSQYVSRPDRPTQTRWNIPGVIEFVSVFKEKILMYCQKTITQCYSDIHKQLSSSQTIAYTTYIKGSCYSIH